MKLCNAETRLNDSEALHPLALTSASLPPWGTRPRQPCAFRPRRFKALAGDDDTYADLEARLTAITSIRDFLAAKMLDELTDTEFQGKRISEGRELVHASNTFVDYVNWLASR